VSTRVASGCRNRRKRERRGAVSLDPDREVADDPLAATIEAEGAVYPVIHVRRARGPADRDRQEGWECI
jgi:hypothetical protein